MRRKGVHGREPILFRRLKYLYSCWMAITSPGFYINKLMLATAAQDTSWAREMESIERRCIMSLVHVDINELQSAMSTGTWRNGQTSSMCDE